MRGGWGVGGDGHYVGIGIYEGGFLSFRREIK
jgi:hypothetical protein